MEKIMDCISLIFSCQNTQLSYFDIIKAATPSRLCFKLKWSEGEVDQFVFRCSYDPYTVQIFLISSGHIGDWRAKGRTWSWQVTTTAILRSCWRSRSFLTAIPGIYLIFNSLMLSQELFICATVFYCPVLQGLSD